VRIAGLQAWVIALALRFRGIVTALSVLLVAYGIYGLNHASYDAFPEFAPPQVDVQTEAPGLSAEQVELRVTRAIEAAISGVPNLQRITSSSIQGLSDIKVYFDLATDVYRARQLVGERLAVTASQLPAGVRPPAMTPLTSSAATVLVIGLTSASQSLMSLHTIAKWVIRPRLLAVPGVAGAEIFGGDERSIQILVHPDRLVRFGLGIDDVLAAARRATGVRGAGFVETPNQRVTLQTEGQSVTPADIARTVVARQDGASVVLGDLADVVDAPEPAIGGAAIMGQPGVVMNIDEQYGANTAEVTRGIEAALADLQPGLLQAGVTLHPALFRPANFITAAIDNLGSSLTIGAVLVVVVLFLFLFDLRTAAICTAAIPLSLLAALVVTRHFGVTLNTMTLGGLAIALGEVVDDAVIGVENIARRLRENKRQAEPRSAAAVALEATFEVRSAVVYATFAVILVFLPVVTLSGVAGRLFAPLGITYILAVLASLVTAITVTPALCLLLLPQHLNEREPPVIDWTRRRYVAAMRRVVRAPRLVIAGAAGLTIAGLALLPFCSAIFLPELQERHFIVHMTSVPGTSIAEALRIGARVTEILLKSPAVGSVAQRVGRAELAAAGDTHGTHQSEFEVELKPLSDGAPIPGKADILKALGEFPGVNLSANTFLAERINETFSGYATPVAIHVYGSDLAAIGTIAQQVADTVRGIRGAASVETPPPLALPQLTIALRSRELRQWGVDPLQVLDAVRAAYQGEVVGQTYDRDRAFDVIVKLAPQRRAAFTEIGELPLRSSDGSYITLRQVADLQASSGLYLIQHQGGRRMQAVTMDVQGRDLAAFEREARQAIAAAVRLPEDTYIEFSGAAEAQQRAQRDLAVKAMFATAGIMLLLSMVTRNWRNQMVMVANLPFSLVGGVVAAFASGGVLSLGSLIGFVTLFGITLRNSMMMIAHYENLVAVEGRAWTAETAVQGAADRLAAVLMTSLVTGLALLPLAVGMNAPGREIEGPMAWVILGGLFTSMALNLLVLPALALRYGRFEPRPRLDQPTSYRNAAE
jgi:CzcA family heavy metal efflux pump